MSLSKAKRKAQDVEQDQPTADKRRRDFERSLAGPSVGKAGLMRDQTGESPLRPSDAQR